MQPKEETFFDNIIRVEEEYYILASSSLVDDRTRVLKHGETFAVFDRYGDIQPLGMGEQGIYHEGTRYLSQWTLTLGKDRPLLLSSTIKQNNAVLTADLANPDVNVDDQILVPRGTLHIFRAKFLWKGVCYERIRIANFGLFPIEVSFSFRFAADFADIFEVRGVKRDQKGTLLQPVIRDDGVALSYKGLDGVIRRTHIHATPKPKEVNEGLVRFEKKLQSKSESRFLITVTFEREESPPPERLHYLAAYRQASRFLEGLKEQECSIETSNPRFNDWISRSHADLQMMLTETSHGYYPYAGVPWFSTVFGRDGIITAMQYLWANPAVAKGVLSYLAETQAIDFDPAKDAEPGKILHETRKGEMAALGEIPFGRYYGSIDSTPLFIMLAGDYYYRTGDRDFIQTIWPNVERALEWIDLYGDRDQDGFVEYSRRTVTGLIQQGWKDSHDSVFYRDGAMAEPPIALCEVQAYVYAAKKGAAALATTLGFKQRAAQLEKEAEDLKRRFEEVFWSKEMKFYALALDYKKRPCLVRTSNAGHALFTGIADERRAKHLAESLLSDDLFSGWGIRTLAKEERRYNPMSYHNGSIWPHDNAIIASGLARYGFKNEVLSILSAMFEASYFFDLHRMPELFCGFPKRPGEAPTLYPVACSPQAWAAGSVYQLLQACLGLRVNASSTEISFFHPILPEYLDYVMLRNLRVKDSSIDLVLKRGSFGDAGVNVLRRHGTIRISILK